MDPEANLIRLFHLQKVTCINSLDPNIGSIRCSVGNLGISFCNRIFASGEKQDRLGNCGLRLRDGWRSTS